MRLFIKGKIMKVKELVAKLMELEEISSDVANHPLITEFGFVVGVNKKHPKFKKFKKIADKTKARQQEIDATKKILNETTSEKAGLSPEDTAVLLNQLINVAEQLKSNKTIDIELVVGIIDNAKGREVSKALEALKEKSPASETTDA